MDTPSYLRSLASIARRYSILIAITVALAALFMLYGAGYRVGPSLTLVRAGDVVLEGLPQRATVYADETRRATSSGGDVRVRLTPGNHSIIVDMPGGYPWNDVVFVEAGSKAVVRPINVPREPVKRRLTPEETARAQALLRTYALPTPAHPLALGDGCVSIAVSGKNVLATGTTTPPCAPPSFLCAEGACEPILVFPPAAAPRAIVPLPGHDDAFVMSYGNLVAVIEVDPRAPQFFAPLLEGEPAVALPWGEHSLLLATMEGFFELTLP